MTKPTFNTWFDLVPKAITPALLIYIIFNTGKLEERLFDTIDDKINTKNHVNNSLKEIELHALRNHITDPNVHMSKEAKDSIYVRRKEFEELIGRDATTKYQTKEEIREIKQLIRVIHKDLEDVKKKLATR